MPDLDFSDEEPDIDLNPNAKDLSDEDLNAKAYEEKRKKKRFSRQSFSQPSTSQPASPNQENSTNKRSVTRVLSRDVHQVKQDYSAWLQIVSDNRLTKHDPFQLKLIDYMSQMCNTRDNTGNFQFAATSIDAGARIYARKVDQVHDETYKILKNLVKKAPEPEQVELENQEEQPQMEDVTDESMKKKLKPKKSKSNLMTQEQNDSMIMKTKFEITDPHLKYRFILHSMTSTDVGDLSKMSVCIDKSVSDSGMPEQLIQFFKDREKQNWERW